MHLDGSHAPVLWYSTLSPEMSGTVLYLRTAVQTVQYASPWLLVIGPISELMKINRSMCERLHMSDDSPSPYVFGAHRIFTLGPWGSSLIGEVGWVGMTSIVNLSFRAS